MFIKLPLKVRIDNISPAQFAVENGVLAASESPSTLKTGAS
jgi:hypothetical protein